MSRAEPLPVGDRLLDARECAKRAGMHPRRWYAFARTQPLLEQARRPLGVGPKPRQRWIESLFLRWMKRGDERRAAS